MLTSSEIVQYETVECCECGCRFAMDRAATAAQRRQKSTWHCPNGHRQNWTKTALQIAEDSLTEAKRKIESLELALETCRKQRNSAARQVKAWKTRARKAGAKS